MANRCADDKWQIAGGCGLSCGRGTYNCSGADLWTRSWQICTAIGTTNGQTNVIITSDGQKHFTKGIKIVKAAEGAGAGAGRQASEQGRTHKHSAHPLANWHSRGVACGVCWCFVSAQSQEVLNKFNTSYKADDELYNKGAGCGLCGVGAAGRGVEPTNVVFCVDESRGFCFPIGFLFALP